MADPNPTTAFKCGDRVQLRGDAISGVRSYRCGASWRGVIKSKRPGQMICVAWNNGVQASVYRLHLERVVPSDSPLPPEVAARFSHVEIDDDE